MLFRSPAASGWLLGESFSRRLLTQVLEESPLLFAGQELVVAGNRKHGLFARHGMDFAAHKEYEAEYENLWSGFRNDYQPVGTAEELEVERIAICWWKLKRAWRHENAMNRVALRNLGSQELRKKAEVCKEKDEEEKAVILLLQSATNMCS